MKKLIFIVIALGLFSFRGSKSPFEETNLELRSDTSKGSLRKMKNDAFKRGEKLTYRIHYGVLDAATATLEITDENKQIGGRNSLHVVGIGTSKGSFEWFFKVRDRYETYIDEEALVPWIFIRRIDEGGYKMSQNQVYNHYKKQVDSDGKIFDTPEGVQDMLSAFYFARTMDFTNAKKGDLFSVPTFMDNELWELKIKYLGKETIKTEVGKVKCLKFVPVVQKGRIFKKEEDLKMWISDDKNHVPIRAQCEILFGSLKIDLQECSGLPNPLNLDK